MSNLYQTSQKRDYAWDFLLSQAHKGIGCMRYDFVKEPTKYLNFGESTYSDHFGPKVNFPSPCFTGPIAIPLACDRVKHLVSTTQQDFDKRKVATNTGSLFNGSSEFEDICGTKESATVHRERPEEILTTIGPIPLVKTCRRQQEWETIYQKDYQYVPPRERMYPFPRRD